MESRVVQVGFRPTGLLESNEFYISDDARHRLFEARCGDRVFVRNGEAHKDKEVIVTREPAKASNKLSFTVSLIEVDGSSQSWLIDNSKKDFIVEQRDGLTFIQSTNGYFTLITELKHSVEIK